MGYLDKTLSDGETVLGRASFHWSYTLGASLLLLVGIALAWFGWWYFPDGGPYRWIAWTFAALLALAFLKLMIDKWTTEIAVTDRRFIYKRGWIARHTQELPIRRVEEVNLDQSVLGRILGYGRLLVHGTGGDIPIELPTIDSPMTFQKALVEASHRVSERASADGRD